MTRKVKPYVSIDLEFTGLDISQAQILEIGAVYDDGSSRLEDMPTFSSVIHYDRFGYAELIALVMNGNLLKEISLLKGDDKDLHSQKMVLTEFSLWLESLRTKDEKGKLERLVVAGKNAAGADIPILKNNCAMAGIPDLTNKFTHRTLDVGSMFFDAFGENVTLGRINEVTGRSKEVSHRALDDAWDVVYGIRKKLQLWRNAMKVWEDHGWRYYSDT